MSRKLKAKLSSRILKKKLKKQSNSSKRRCRFCSTPQAILDLDYKNVDLLKTFLTERGKILPSRVSGNTAKCQRVLAKAIKLARTMALLPYCPIVER